MRQGTQGSGTFLNEATRSLRLIVAPHRTSRPSLRAPAADAGPGLRGARRPRAGRRDAARASSAPRTLSRDPRLCGLSSVLPPPCHPLAARAARSDVDAATASMSSSIRRLFRSRPGPGPGARSNRLSRAQNPALISSKITSRTMVERDRPALRLARARRRRSGGRETSPGTRAGRCGTGTGARPTRSWRSSCPPVAA